MDKLTVEGLGKRYVVPSKRAAEEAPPSLNLGFARLTVPRLRLPGRPLQGRDLTGPLFFARSEARTIAER